ncbi:lipoprotein [Hyunsoonleella aestuarii]|uniref:Lipoprotein n=1 Tax=Hyunsoonleella aestuarii TaxID=912802 RepID=A0ABP8E8Y4_9FLAO
MLSCSSDDSENNEQNFEVSSIKTFGGTKNESGNKVIRTNDGGYAVIGYTQSNDGDIENKIDESFDYWLLKFDLNNQLQLSKTYGGNSNDRASDIIQTSDNGFALIGFSFSNDGNVTSNAGIQDFWLIKLDTSGDISWEKSFGFSGLDRGISIIETNDNGYLLIGELDVTASGGEGNSKYFTSKGHAGGDYWAIKLDSYGNKQWSKFYGGTFTDTPNDVVQTIDNNYIIVGSSDSVDVDITNNKGSYDFWVIKISETGSLIWEKSFGGTEIDKAYGITTTNDGNYLIIGDTRSSDQDVSNNYGAADLWLIKITPNGDLLWDKSLGGSNFDSGSAISKTHDGSFILSGNSRSSNGNLTENEGQNDAWIIKIDLNASIEWQKTIGGTEIDFTNDVTQLNGGTYVAIGETSSSNQDITENKGFSDLLIITINE